MPARGRIYVKFTLQSRPGGRRLFEATRSFSFVFRAMDRRMDEGEPQNTRSLWSSPPPSFQDRVRGRGGRSEKARRGCTGYCSSTNSELVVDKTIQKTTTENNSITNSKMDSRFWAGASSDSDSDSDSGSDASSSSSDDNQGAANRGGVKWNVISDSESSEDEARVVKSAKQRAMETFQQLNKQLRTNMKDRDYWEIQNSFDELSKAMIKAKAHLAQGVPRFLVRLLCDLEDYIAERLQDKAQFKKLSARQGRALNRMKLTLKKHNKAYQVVMDAYRQNPDTDDPLADDDDDDDEDGDGGAKDDGSSSNSGSSSSSSSSSSAGSDSDSDGSDKVRLKSWNRILWYHKDARPRGSCLWISSFPTTQGFCSALTKRRRVASLC